MIKPNPPKPLLSTIQKAAYYVVLYLKKHPESFAQLKTEEEIHHFSELFTEIGFDLITKAVIKESYYEKEKND